MGIRGLSILVVAVATAACGAAASTPELGNDTFFFPRVAEPFDAGDTALVQGVPHLRDGCILLELDEGTEMLVLWPPGVEPGIINSQPVVLSVDAPIGPVEMGFRIELAGSATDPATAATLVGAIPEECTTDSVWVTTAIGGRP